MHSPQKQNTSVEEKDCTRKEEWRHTHFLNDSPLDSCLILSTAYLEMAAGAGRVNGAAIPASQVWRGKPVRGDTLAGQLCGAHITACITALQSRLLQVDAAVV